MASNSYNPSMPQSKFKVRLYAEHSPLNWSTLTGVGLQTLTGNRSIQKWYDQEDFRDWLQEPDTDKLMIKASTQDAIQVLLDIITEDSVGPGGRVTAASQVAAARIILEFAGLAPASHKVIEYKDKDIEKMSAPELREYVKKNIHLIK